MDGIGHGLQFQEQHAGRTEESIHSELYDVLKVTGLFSVYTEVIGHPIFLHPAKTYKNYRADILLIPRPKLISAGWVYGSIIIEIKASGDNAGKAASQLLDYMDAEFVIPSNHCLIRPQFGLLYPFTKIGRASCRKRV